MGVAQGDRSKEDLLVLSAQAGNMRAFELLYRLHHKPLLRFAYRLSNDEALSHDAVQEAWITLSKTISKLKDPRGFRVWAYKTVRWRITDQVRKRGIMHEPFDEQFNCAAPDAQNQGATSHQLRAHIDQLPADDKHTLTLFYLGELSLVEIAAVLSLPVGTVKSRLNRARNKLREQMAGEGP